MLPIVTKPNGKKYTVNNLRWLITKVGKTTIDSFIIGHSSNDHDDLWIVVCFHDGYVYFTHYASYAVFCGWINRSRTLRGTTVTLVDPVSGNLSHCTTDKLPPDYMGMS